MGLLWDKKQFEEMFIEAGRWSVDYERDDTEELQLRNISLKLIDVCYSSHENQR